MDKSASMSGSGSGPRFRFEFEGVGAAWLALLDGDQRVRSAFAQEWAKACRLPSNQSLKPIEGKEGGLEPENKHFKLVFQRNKNTLIVAVQDRGNVQWRIDRLLDLLDAFSKTAHTPLRAELIFS